MFLFSPPSECKSCVSTSMEGIRIDIIAHWLGEVHICPLVLKFGVYLIMSRHFSSHKCKWIMQKTWVRKDARQKQAFPSTVSIRLFENFWPVCVNLVNMDVNSYKACGVYLIGWLQSLKWSTIFLGRLVGWWNKKIRLALWMELEDEEFETSWRKEGNCMVWWLLEWWFVSFVTPFLCICIW
jgi:hypothetical protein